MPTPQPRTGQFVSLRGRLWLVEGEPDTPLAGHTLACVDDNASGEEVLSVAADWAARPHSGLRALAAGRDAEGRVLDEMLAALGEARLAASEVVATATEGAREDVAELRPALEARAAGRRERVEGELARRAEAEAVGLERLLTARIERIRREQGQDHRQFEMTLDEAEARQRAADRRAWERAATRLDDELEREPERLRASYRVRASRLEPIGVVYLWPETAA